ncbi:MAG: hypothetical protein ACI31F_02220 [Muribaculaceae bacterium]
MSDNLRPEKIRVWFWIILILNALPLLLVPVYLADIETTGYVLKKPFIWFYIPYVIIGTALTALCYRYGRKAMAWILFALMLLTHAAMYLLIYAPL